jgi:uncharacterized membrane protein YbhN (UPF0104 family)
LCAYTSTCSDGVARRGCAGIGLCRTTTGLAGTTASRLGESSTKNSDAPRAAATTRIAATPTHADRRSRAPFTEPDDVKDPSDGEFFLTPFSFHRASVQLNAGPLADGRPLTPFLTRGRQLGRTYAVGVALLFAGGIALAATRIGRGTFDSALASLSDARPGWLLVAAGAFAVGLLFSAAAWSCGLRPCGSEAAYSDVCARYAVGSLVNAVAPASLGGVVRLALMSQTLRGEERVWRAGGIGGAVAAARALSLSALIVVAAVWAEIPLWPAPVLAAVVLSVVFVCMRLSRRVSGHVRSLLQVFCIFRGSYRAGAALFAWVLLAALARIAAAAAMAVSLGVQRPIFVALVLVTAVSLSGVLPLTPGNFGTGAGAVALALHGTGVPVGPALAVGVAFQAVETFTGMTLGLAGVASLASPASRVRRVSVGAALVGAVAVSVALGVMSTDLV